MRIIPIAGRPGRIGGRPMYLSLFLRAEEPACGTSRSGNYNIIVIAFTTYNNIIISVICQIPGDSARWVFVRIFYGSAAGLMAFVRTINKQFMALNYF